MASSATLEPSHSSPPKRNFTLNPNAPPFVPPLLESESSLYFTFSRGQPITPAYIINFFNQLLVHGDCVRRVDINCPWNGGLPLYGKVVFETPVYPRCILQGAEKVRFIVDGKPLICKKFMPRHLRNC